MDETFRTELLEVNEAHWKRFEAVLDARFAAFDLKMEQGFAALKAAFDAEMRERLGGMDPWITAMDARFDRFEARVNWHFDNQIRLMVVLWLATVVPLGGLMVGLFNSIR